MKSGILEEAESEPRWLIHRIGNVDVAFRLSFIARPPFCDSGSFMVKRASLPEAAGARDLKSNLRRQFRSARQSLVADPSRWESVQSQICAHLKRFLSEQPHGAVWGCYSASPQEVNLQPALSDSLRWAYPVLNGLSLRYYLPHGSRFRPNRFGILEPDPALAEEIAVGNLSGVLVPGLAFDDQGTRLGHGQGFFDRALQSYNGIKIGVAPVTQIARDKLPREAHDIVMTHLVSERDLRGTSRKD